MKTGFNRRVVLHTGSDFGASPTITISPHVIKPLNYDSFKDLVPLTPILSYTNVLVVNASLPIKSVADLVAYAKANPHKLMYGSAGMDAPNQLRWASA